MYAVLVTVRIDPARHGEALAGLHDGVVPQAKSAPGFVRGTWFGDQHSGHGLMVFQSEDQASQVAGMVSSAPDDPVQVIDVHVYQVNAEA